MVEKLKKLLKKDTKIDQLIRLFNYKNVFKYTYYYICQ